LITFFTDRNLGRRFGELLRERGLSVEIHDDHLEPQSPDIDVLRYATARGYVVLTADYRMRYRPAEKEAIIAVGAVVVHIKPSMAWTNEKLAKHFADNIRRVERYLKTHDPPLFVVYRIDQKGRVKIADKLR